MRSRCGTTWYLPKTLAKEKRPTRLQKLDAKLDTAGSTLMMGAGGAAAEQRRARIEAKGDRVTANARCPNCGSTKFSQRKG